MLERANALAARPEFYNTFTSSCTTNIVDHVNAIAPRRVPFSYKVYLPAFADALAYELGLFSTSIPFDELRKRAYVSDRSRRLASDAHALGYKVVAYNNPYVAYGKPEIATELQYGLDHDLFVKQPDGNSVMPYASGSELSARSKHTVDGQPGSVRLANAAVTVPSVPSCQNRPSLGAASPGGGVGVRVVIVRV